MLFCLRNGVRSSLGPMGNSVGFGQPSGVAAEHENFCQRLGGALCGATRHRKVHEKYQNTEVCVGLLLFLGSIFLLGWNEFNYVRNQVGELFSESQADSRPSY